MTNINEITQDIKNIFRNLLINKFKTKGEVAYFLVTHLPLSSIITLYNRVESSTSQQETSNTEPSQENEQSQESEPSQEIIEEKDWYQIEIIGYIEIENPIVSLIKEYNSYVNTPYPAIINRLPIHIYKTGDIVQINETDKVFYRAKNDGRTSKEDNINFLEEDEYTKLREITDGQVIWEYLGEIKDWETEINFEAGDIIVRDDNYYMAMNDGCCHFQKTYYEQGKEQIQDEEVTWNLQSVRLKIFDTIAYTDMEKSKEARFNFEINPIYLNKELTTALTLENIINISNPISIEHETISKEIEYTATYTGVYYKKKE